MKMVRRDIEDGLNQTLKISRTIVVLNRMFRILIICYSLIT